MLFAFPVLYGYEWSTELESEKTIKTLTEAVIDSIVTGTLKYSKVVDVRYSDL